jgi:hypothetical protein
MISVSRRGLIVEKGVSRPRGSTLKARIKDKQESIDVAIKCRPGKTIKKSYEKLLIG